MSGRQIGWKRLSAVGVKAFGQGLWSENIFRHRYDLADMARWPLDGAAIDLCYASTEGVVFLGSAKAAASLEELHMATGNRMEMVVTMCGSELESFRVRPPMGWGAILSQRWCKTRAPVSDWCSQGEDGSDRSFCFGVVRGLDKSICRDRERKREEVYVLKEWPSAQSIDKTVMDKGYMFIWDPREQVPYMIPPALIDRCKINVPRKHRICATRVVEYVPQDKNTQKNKLIHQKEITWKTIENPSIKQKKNKRKQPI